MDPLTKTLVGAVEGVGNAFLGAVDKVGEMGYAMVDAMRGDGSRGAALESSDMGSMAQGAMQVVPTTGMPMESFNSLQSALSQAGNTISSAVQAAGNMVSTTAQQLMGSMQDLGQGTSFLADGGQMPSMQAGLPMGMGGQAMGRA